MLPYLRNTEPSGWVIKGRWLSRVVGELVQLVRRAYPPTPAETPAREPVEVGYRWDPQRPHDCIYRCPESRARVVLSVACPLETPRQCVTAAWYRLRAAKRGLESCLQDNQLSIQDAIGGFIAERAPSSTSCGC